MARVRQLPPARRNGAARRFLLDDLYASTADQRRRTNGVRVRVVEYTLEDHPKHETYRLMTTLLDHVQAPALELAALYPERWEMEGVFDELKTHLRGGQQVVLRSKTPALVEQEIYGLLLAHRAVRTLMCRAAQGAQLDPDRLSFTHSVRVLRRKLARPPAFPLSSRRAGSVASCWKSFGSDPSADGAAGFPADSNEKCPAIHCVTPEPPLRFSSIRPSSLRPLLSEQYWG